MSNEEAPPTEETSNSADQIDMVLPPGEKYAVATLTFWDNACIKVVETLISVKLWGLVAITSLSSIFLVKGLLDGGQWVTVNSTVYGLIYGMREAFKISRIYQRAKTGDPKLGNDIKV